MDFYISHVIVLQKKNYKTMTNSIDYYIERGNFFIPSGIFGQNILRRNFITKIKIVVNCS